MSKEVCIRQAVILAGGVGKRLKPLTDTIPKPMIPINGTPFLQYLIELLKKNGITDLLLLLGYLPEKITEYFGDGSRLGVRIKYLLGDVGFKTGTRIKKAAALLEKHFLLLYCDNYWPLNLRQLLSFYNQHKKSASVAVYANEDRVTKNNIHVDAKGFVLKYDKTRKAEDLNGVEIGFFILDKKILALMPNRNFSFEEKIIPKLIKKRELVGFLTPHRYYSIGSLERLPLTQEFLRPKRVLFLDRDGVINKKAPKSDYVKKWDEFEFLPGSIEAIQLLAKNHYDIYIITNQAGIARKMMSERDLRIIHENMLKELMRHGIRIKKIYYCPHGWDEGCNCRKPKPGMFFQAAREYPIDLTKAILIGDEERDIEAGQSAGIRTIRVTPQRDLLKITRSLLE